MTSNQSNLAGRSFRVLGIALLGLTIASAAQGQPAAVGQWSAPFDFQNVAIHVSVLPDGTVMFWGRREAGEDLNPHTCVTRIWDPKAAPGPGAFSLPAKQPNYNLFCGGHTFLQDGRLFVAGGHILDGKGVKFASIYDWKAKTWTQLPDMSGGRWYPTAVALADGGVLVSFGTDEAGANNTTQQVWKDGSGWRNIVKYDPPPYYPRMHVVPDGRIFMSGPLPLTQFLDTGTSSAWTFLRTDPDINKAVALSSRSNGFRDYASSVLYNDGQILYAGGGIGPTANAEVLDLNAALPGWKGTEPMHFPRRHHEATLLPDGTVLVTGGTRGKRGPAMGFNDLSPGAPVHTAELWNPKKGKWTVLSDSAVDRCYHGTAVLLPDATVLNAGGGEYSPNNDGVPNAPVDSHKDAQIYSPPYLFAPGGRPDITSAPADVTYGAKFDIGTSNPAQVGQVTWLRLSSTTHAFNSGQRISFLKFAANATSITVTAPASANLCPPGHYMLFVLNKTNVPSVARIVRIH